MKSISSAYRPQGFPRRPKSSPKAKRYLSALVVLSSLFLANLVRDQQSWSQMTGFAKQSVLHQWQQIKLLFDFHVTEPRASSAKDSQATVQVKATADVSPRQEIRHNSAAILSQTMARMLNDLNGTVEKPDHPWKLQLQMQTLGKDLQDDRAAWEEGLAFYQSCLWNLSIAKAYRIQCLWSAQDLRHRLSNPTEEWQVPEDLQGLVNLTN